MKKFYSLLITGAASLLTVTAVNARSLSPAEALSRLAGSDVPRKAAAYVGSAVNPELRLTVNTPAGEPAVYLFANSDSTLMVVGANDIAAPLLAYGLTPGKGEMPPQFKDWLRGYAADIATADSIIATGTAPAAPRKVKKASSSDVIEPLMTTTWNQGNPYNYYCPEQDGEKSVTGCVATAMAQVLKYYEYPKKGKGEGHATCNNEELTRSLEVTFEWDQMRNNYPGSANPARATAVAELMVTCGFAADMGYSPSGSGAGNGNVPRAFVNNFSYDVTAQLFARDRYTLDTWEDMLITELKDNGPVYYSGFSKDGGHAFVCDGYNGKGYFHFNWGWGGYCDGYFKIDDLEPSGQGIGGYEGGYNLGQVAMLNVHEPRRGSRRPDMTIVQGDDFNVTLTSGRNLKIDGFWFNDYFEARNVYFGFEYTNAATGESQYQSLFGPVELNSGWGYTSMQADIPDLADGTYEVRVVCRTSLSKDWERMLYNLSKQGFAVISCRDGYSILGDKIPEVSVVSASFLNTALKQNETTNYTIEFNNTYDSDRNVPVKVALLDEDGVTKASSAPKRIRVPKLSTTSFDVGYDVEYDSSFDFSKEYEHVLCNNNSGEIYHSFGMVRVEPDENNGIVSAAAGDAGIGVAYDAATRRAVAVAGAAITSVAVFSPAGTLLDAPVAFSGNSAEIDLSHLSGIVFVTVNDAAGSTSTVKAAL